MSQPGWGARARDLLRSYWTPAGRRAFWNLLILVLCTVVSQGLGFWGLIILTNGLGPEGYGAVALAATVQWYLLAVGGFGLPSLVVRDLTQRPDDTDAIATGYLGITAVAAATAGLTVAAAVWLVPLNPGERVYLTVIGLCNVVVCLSFGPLYDVAHRQALGAVLGLPLEVANLLALLALRAAGLLTIENLAALHMVRVLVGATIPVVVYHYRVRPIRLRWDRVWVRRFLGGGWPSMLATLVAMIPFHAGLLLARVWRGERETGVYGVAMAIGFAYFGVGMLGVRVVQPHIAGPHGRDRRFLWKLVAFGALLVGGLWAAVAAAAYVLFFHLLDPSYRPAFVPTLLLMTAMTFLLTAVFGNCYLFLFRRERLIMWLYGATAALYLAAAALSREAPLPWFAGAATVSTAALAAATTAAAVRAARRTPPREPGKAC